MAQENDLDTNLADQTAQLQTLCRLLLDEERLAISGLLGQNAETLPSIASKLSLKPAMVSRHLQQLCDGGIVHTQMQNGETHYTLDRAGILALKKELFQSGVHRADLSDSEQVLRSFVKDGRLTHLPINRDKMVVVLAWMATLFEMEVEYAEREVNELIQQRFDDHATLRRYLVDYGFMDRERGRYWRLK